MTKAIGGYVRRCERRYVPPAPDDGMRGPSWYRHAVLPSGGVITWRLEPPAYEMPPLSQSFLPLGVPAASGEIMASILGADEPEPGPAYTLADSPYRAEILADEPTHCWFPEDEPLPPPPSDGQVSVP